MRKLSVETVMFFLGAILMFLAVGICAFAEPTNEATDQRTKETLNISVNSINGTNSECEISFNEGFGQTICFVPCKKVNEIIAKLEHHP